MKSYMGLLPLFTALTDSFINLCIRSFIHANYRQLQQHIIHQRRLLFRRKLQASSPGSHHPRISHPPYFFYQDLVVNFVTYTQVYMVSTYAQF